MKHFVWKRRNIFLDEYKKEFITENSSISDKETEKRSKSKLKKAYKVASDIRKFEISLFWKRATFFWAFITAIYTAYFNVLVKIYPCGNSGQPPYHHGKIPLLILSALGLFFCFSWLLSSKGSKHWQENWENHIDLLEDDVTGPLYKVYKAGKAYSESKLTIAAGWAVTICAYGLLLYEFSCFIQDHITEKGIFSFLVVFAFALIIAILMYIFSQLMKGTSEKSGSITFQIKEYEGLNE